MVMTYNESIFLAAVNKSSFDSRPEQSFIIENFFIYFITDNAFNELINSFTIPITTHIRFTQS